MQPCERIEKVMPVAVSGVHFPGFEDAGFVIGLERFDEADFLSVFVADGLFREDPVVVRIIRPVFEAGEGEVGQERISRSEVGVPVFQNFTLARYSRVALPSAGTKTCHSAVLLLVFS